MRDGSESSQDLVEQFGRKRTSVCDVQRVGALGDVVSKPQDSGIRRVQAWSVLHHGRWEHCVKRRRENVAHDVDVRWSTIEESDISGGEVANVNKALGSVSKMVRKGNKQCGI